MDKASFICGWLTGRRIAGQRKKTEKVPVAYLYNGVRLPKLPEWDRESYPYAVIFSYEGTSYTSGEPITQYTLYCVAEKWQFHAPSDTWYSTYWCKIPTPYCYCTHIGGETSWRDNWTEGTGEGMSVPRTGRTPVWSNFDITDTGGTVCLAASEPVPVYE